MWQDCIDLQEELVKIRRELHQIPEERTELPKTRAYVEEKLTEWGIPYVENEFDSGLIGIIQGSHPGKTIALRADMDGLPIHEENPVDYASRHEGYMHACGHDAHMTMLLGAAKVLNDHREELAGTVKLFFQTGEETCEGAKVMVEHGCLDGVDAVFGTHIGTILSKNIPSGTLVVVPGCCMASIDKFIIRVHATGCHASTPEKGVDPINIGSHIVINLQEVLAREIAAVKPAVLTIGHMEAGSTYNVIPNDLLIEGTIRTFDQEVRKYLAKRIEEISVSTAQTFRGSAEVEMVWGAAPVINDPEMARLAAESARQVLGEEMVIDHVEAPNMGGEDFAFYLEKKPGAFMFLSSSNHEKGTDLPHHNPRFQIDEDVLWSGSAVFVKIVENFFQK